ncbi:aminopeptidase P family N-terminal domain-containing protein [Faecalicatena contorta]|uniref:aminopeptidase P family N-terminal domain-containing protein n=1 Tax=Faecalicatena contorta TaxID=39482 RepID=UPI001F17E9F9|nr:aminopeptidase P family N-terminal domain-containing protein [Faecalicatena contorta]MCF2682388.1 aminopeptidase P family N-terminal domain-containing protein [Faecalicatena contorta]
MSIPERLKKLRIKMEEKGVDVYIVPTADFHQNEYVGEYFKARKYITGFSGSAGTAVITKDEARLWTDGRYFIQAAQQLKDTTVELMKIGVPGVPTLPEYLKEVLKSGDTLGFDGRVVSVGEGEEYAKVAEEKQAKVAYHEDLIDLIWEDRPELSKASAFSLGIEYAGETAADKLKRIREKMEKAGANVHVLTTLDDICWTLNIRGDDIEFFPLVLSYAIIRMDSMELYVDENKLNDEIKAQLNELNVHLHPYNDIYEDICKLDGETVALIDPGKLNYALYNNIPENVKKVEAENPTMLMKSAKNPVEVENIRKAQIKDSVAHVRFMKWLKENVGKTRITEMSATEKLDELRAEMGNFIRPSFEPIASYGEHGAIVHYISTPETDVELKEGNFFMTDTGAGFWEGSTDVTRTYALGEVTQQMKDDFTLVAISNLSLGSAKFLEGCTGIVLDLLARKPFWDRNLNFNHGTGHGVGYLLNIHESPASFRWRYVKGDTAVLQEGMVITDEPGFYVEGSHGIRLENELLCCKGEKNEYGQFMYFDEITLIPMDLDAINPDIMTEEEKKLLNNYHKKVYDTISPYLNKEETEWLAKYTRAV